MTHADINDLETRDYVFKIGDREKGIQARYDKDTDALIFPRAVFDYVYELLKEALSQEPTDTWSIKDVADTFKKHGLIREQEPCDDAIDREYLFKVLDDFCGHDRTATITLDTLADLVYDMPTVTQKPIKCEDAISREQLLKVVTGDSFKSDYPRMSKALAEIIKALPSVSTTKNIVNHGTMNITL